MRPGLAAAGVRLACGLALSVLACQTPAAPADVRIDTTAAVADAPQAAAPAAVSESVWGQVPKECA
jgi:hypothetical protein